MLNINDKNNNHDDVDYRLVMDTLFACQRYTIYIYSRRLTYFEHL